MPRDAADPDQTDRAEPPPRDFRALRERIVERRGSLPKRLLQVADFAVEHPQEIAFGRVADLAGLAGVQPSTLIRFAQALGFSGFSDMQAVFLDHARARWPDYRARVAALGEAPQAGEAADLLRGFMRAASESIERLDHSIDRAALQSAVDLLAGAATIYLLGTRRAFGAIAYLAYALRRLGVRCELVDQQAGLGAEQVALIGRDDALLAVSFTPYASLTLDLATAAHRRGVPVVAITDSPFSPLTPMATIWLEVADADHAAFRSLAGTFTVATTLAVAVAARRGGRADSERVE